jgi:molecular chaperone DnaK (HSP70)
MGPPSRTGRSLSWRSVNRPDPIVGIDLGTTNSLVAVAIADGKPSAPRILPDARGRGMVPSVVRFGSDGRAEAVGHDARARSAEFPLATVQSVKRLMGRSLADAEKSGDPTFLSYRVVAGPQGAARVALPGAGGGAAERLVSPQEVSAVILRTLREQASAALGVPVSRAVITVPAYFDDAQRQATRDAARLAGLEPVRIINEPTAAALAYGLGLRAGQRQEQLVAVYDLGGGTFDVSILRITPGAGAADHAGVDAPVAADCFEVLATAGDTHLGGDDMDHAVLSALEAAGAPAGTPGERQTLRQKAEAAKIALSAVESVEVDLGGGHRFTLTREKLEALIAPLVERTLESCARALRDASRKLDGQRVGAVVLVGGATRVPLVRRRVAEFFGMEPYTALNPDEVVALGAAVQGSVLASVGVGGARSLLLDVVPLSLGLETVGGAMAKLIVRNSTVPARAREMFSTSVDNQTAVTLNILQGEREMAADCRSLGTYHLRGIPPMPAGIPKLRVEFAVDASGVLSVSAVEERSGKRLSVQIVPNHGLTQDEVERLERESVVNAREDMLRHRIADLVANSRLDVNWISKQLDRLGTELPAALAGDVRARVDALGGLCDRAAGDWTSVDADEFHKAKEALDRASIPLHELSITRSLREERG